MSALAVPSSPGAQRLRRSADVRAVFAGRRAAHGRTAVVHLVGRDDGEPARWTVVAGRKVGDAPARNRAKRRLRAALAEVALPEGCDLVVVARSAAVTSSYPELRSELAALIGRALARPGRT